MTELSWCGEHARRYDPDRFLAALLAPSERREALLALIAYNVELSRIGEITTEPITGLIRLQWWRETLEGIEQGAPRAHPVAEALHAVEAELPRQLLEAMIDAREADIERQPPADLAGALAYLGATAGNLGELSARALGAEGEALTAAREAAVAFGLVGLLRSIGHDARLGRVLLPADLLGEAGVAHEALLAGRPGPALAEVARALAGETRALLQRARARRRAVPRSAIAALLPARLATLYLRQLRRAGHDPLAMPGRRPASTPLRLLIARTLARY
jgi:NADH dehydrogenase [ubiquinone] 1 alpha subcomplex assembly factor 6